jgi:hypothetical protein
VSSILAGILPIHLLCAAGATVTFWIAAVAGKGGRLHRAAGRWFSRLAYLTAATGAAMAAMRLAMPTPAAERQTMWLVLYVLLIIVAPVEHGLRVVTARAEPVLVRSRWHAFLTLGAMVASVALVPAALLWERWHFLIVAPIGLGVGLRQLAYASRPHATRPEWEREHLTSLLTAGITLHTALLVFGTTRSLGLASTGVASLWPWILPAIVGLPMISGLRSRRR